MSVPIEFLYTWLQRPSTYDMHHGVLALHLDHQMNRVWGE